MENNVYYDQLFKVKILKDKIEHIQDNIASAIPGIIHLTDEEIQKFQIDFIKLQYIKVGLTKFLDTLIVFSIKILKEYINVQLKMIIPIQNQQRKEIKSDKEFLNIMKSFIIMNL